ncbi:MAG: glucose-6-phosphate isomerase, mannose-6-phosphate isomerase, glucose-6-phosphate isomerase [Microgenomates group bacterium GW2011_GWC1_49_7]|nr:MAG: glucose-6-phosphate isomerase, mannose-6-phosphate isomerase, glucose-6-phosphate isomerase [Microgenomates group bacterium GW2011_GWC1_49_7]
MNSLDDVAAMKQKDPSGVLASTAMFPDQCQQAWEESQKVVFPDEYKKVKNIVVAGMGGSRFTPKTIGALYRNKIKVSYEICEDYTVPGYVNSDSLVILCSYSGTTEEVLAAGEDARKKGAKIAGIMSKKMDVPGYYFDPKFNPCGQPRIGGGYLLIGHLGLLKALGFVEAEDKEVTDAIAFAREIGKKYAAEVLTEQNPAKKLALLLKDKHPFIITAEFLKGFGNGFANQINETAKMISDYRYISELNHHLLEGLSHPDSIRQNGLFLFFLSHCYSEPVRKRFGITKDVVTKQQLAAEDIELTGPDKISQVLEAYTLSGFTTYYMAMLYDADPVAIPWVDYFKAQLAK